MVRIGETATSGHHNDRRELIIAKLDPQGYHEISRTKIITPTWPHGRRQGQPGLSGYANKESLHSQTTRKSLLLAGRIRTGEERKLAECRRWHAGRDEDRPQAVPQYGALPVAPLLPTTLSARARGAGGRGGGGRRSRRGAALEGGGEQTDDSRKCRSRSGHQYRIAPSHSGGPACARRRVRRRSARHRAASYATGTTRWLGKKPGGAPHRDRDGQRRRVRGRSSAAAGSVEPAHHGAHPRPTERRLVNRDMVVEHSGSPCAERREGGQAGRQHAALGRAGNEVNLIVSRSSRRARGPIRQRR